MKHAPLSWLFLALPLAACGGPDIDKVKADFDNPSGSVSNKEAVIAANGKRSAGGPALSLAGSGVPGSSQGLSAEGGYQGLQQLDVMRGWANRARATYQGLRTGSKSMALSASQAGTSGDCANSPEAKAAYEDMVSDLFLDALNPLGGGTLNGSADYELDLASCSNGQLTGRTTVELEVELAENHFSFRVSESFDNVCETGGANACVNGELLMEAAATSDGMQAGSFTFVTALEIEGEWNDGGARRTASYRGGVRVDASSNGQMGQLGVQYLFYVTTPDEEVSYVWQLMASTEAGGSASWSVRGGDGSISCMVVADGSGSCTSSGSGGSATLSWTAAEATGLSDDYYGD